MAELQHRNGNLFNAPAHSVLAHACNAQGAWGAGVALQFAARFPAAHAAYKRACAALPADTLTGTTGLYPAPGYAIACLFTSRGYGWRRDPPPVTLEYTRRAVANLLAQLFAPTAINSPRINAGLFGVPWDSTAAVLTEALDVCPIAHTWTVWTL